MHHKSDFYYARKKKKSEYSEGVHLGNAGFKLWLHTSKVLCFNANCPERSTFRYLSSQHGLSEAIKNKFAVSVVFLPFDVLQEIFLWKPSALVVVEVKSGPPSHGDHITLLITRLGWIIFRLYVFIFSWI